MLIALWSAKGGSGTSVFTAACAVVLARDARDGPTRGVRVADLAGDLPAIFGLGADPALGVADWLARGSRGTHRGARPAPRRGRPRDRAPPAGRCRARRRTSLRSPRPARRSPSRSARAPCRRSSTAAPRRDPASRAVVEVADVVRRRPARLLPRPPPGGARPGARVDRRRRSCSRRPGARCRRTT